MKSRHTLGFVCAILTVSYCLLACSAVVKAEKVDSRAPTAIVIYYAGTKRLSFVTFGLHASIIGKKQIEHYLSDEIASASSIFLIERSLLEKTVSQAKRADDDDRRYGVVFFYEDDSKVSYFVGKSVIQKIYDEVPVELRKGALSYIVKNG